MGRVGDKDQRIQALRGVAAILVVILHARDALSVLRRQAFLTDWIVSDNGFGACGVDLFFVISGLVMAMALERNIAPRLFLRARLVRVVPLFWLTSIATIAAILILGDPLSAESMANSITILPLFDRGLIDMPAPPVGWTLAFELYFYLIVTLALALPMQARSNAILAILMIGALIGELAQPILWPLIGILCNPLSLEFGLGLLAWRLARHPVVGRIAPWLIALGVGLLLGSAMLGFGAIRAPEAAVAGQTGFARLLGWGVPSAMVLTGLIARPDRQRTPRPLTRLGDASYALYLVHPLVIRIVPIVWAGSGRFASDGLFGAMLVGAIVAGIAAHDHIERPLLAWLRSRIVRDIPTPSDWAGEETGYAVSVTASASTVRPRSFTSAKPPSTWMRPATLFGPE